MPKNRIDAVLTAEDIEGILGAVDTIRQRMPFLVDLSPAERHQLPKMGDKTRAFVSKALEIAIQTPDLLSAELLAQLRRDVELTVALQPVLVAIIRLAEVVSDSSLLTGSEAFSGALTVYELVKRTGQGEALDVLADELGRRFVKTPRPDGSPEPVG
jgi:hypothetical protein